MAYDVFISYSRRDTAVADRICAALDKAGITYFIDRQGIAGGMEFPEVLAENIIDSELVLFLASKNSYESRFTMNEITFAFNEKKKNSLLPYIIDCSEMPLKYRFTFAGINWRTIEDHPIETVLVNDLLALLGRPASVQPATVATPPAEIKPAPDTSKQEVKPASVPATQKAAKTEPVLIEREQYLLSLPDDEFKPFYIIRNGKKLYGVQLKSTNEHITETKYNYASDFYEGLACVELNGKYGFIDKSGSIAIPLEYDDAASFHEGLARVESNGKYGYIDKSGNVLIPLKYSGASYKFSEGIAQVKINDKWGFIDKTGMEITPLYDEIDSFIEGIARVKLNEKYGFIDKTLKEITPIKYDFACAFNDGLAAIKLKERWGKSKWGQIDKTGKEIW